MGETPRALFHVSYAHGPQRRHDYHLRDRDAHRGTEPPYQLQGSREDTAAPGESVEVSGKRWHHLIVELSRRELEAFLAEVAGGLASLQNPNLSAGNTSSAPTLADCMEGTGRTRMNVLQLGTLRILREGRYVIRRIMVWYNHTFPLKIAPWWQFLPPFWADLSSRIASVTLSGALHAGTFLLKPPLRYLTQTMARVYTPNMA